LDAECGELSFPVSLKISWKPIIGEHHLDKSFEQFVGDAKSTAEIPTVHRIRI
jgi:hypothetical protein